VEQGFGVLIFGRADHDETVVTKSRLAAAGGRYVVVGHIEQARVLCEFITGERNAGDFSRVFDGQATNADGLGPFERLAQVSQTTMLYNQTIQIRGLIRRAMASRYGRDGLEERVMFEPTVCRATQERQSAAVELCDSGLDLVVVVGGFGSSNTRHLYELARASAPAWFIEDAEGILSEWELATIDLVRDERVVARDWLPSRRPLRIGVLAGASSPEIVVGHVLQRLAEFLK
jgi:4-hydroxy-3-methylbut-2-enyl diphosphate reductase